MRLFLFCFVLMLFIQPVWADDLEKEREAVFESLNKLTENLGERELQHFQLTYSNYTLISTVKTVEKSVHKGIKACGENNPSLKSKLDARFDAWVAAVSPVMDDAQGQLKNMIIAQDYIPQKKIENLFSQMDAVREKSENQIDKVPVTTPEACHYLVDKMVETQDGMVALLRQTLVSFPKVYREKEPEVEGDSKGDSKAQTDE